MTFVSVIDSCCAAVTDGDTEKHVLPSENK